MFYPLAEFLRAQGWQDCTVLQTRTLGCLVLLVFRPHQRYPVLVAKLSHPGEMKDFARLEAAALAQLVSVSERVGAPRLLFQRDLPDGRFLLAETGLPGQPAPTEFSSSDPRLAGLFSKAEAWLETFQSSIPPSGTVDATLFQRVLRCKEILPPMSVEEEKLLAAGLSNGPELARVKAVPVHGDFWTGNMLDHEGRISMVDWSAFHFGSPLGDLFNLTADIASRHGNDARVKADIMWPAFFGDSPLAGHAGSAAQRILKRWNVPPETLRSLFMLFLVNRLSMPEFSTHPAWRAFATRYMQSGMPMPWGTLKGA